MGPAMRGLQAVAAATLPVGSWLGSLFCVTTLLLATLTWSPKAILLSVGSGGAFFVYLVIALLGQKQ